MENLKNAKKTTSHSGFAQFSCGTNEMPILASKTLKNASFTNALEFAAVVFLRPFFQLKIRFRLELRYF